MGIPKENILNNKLFILIWFIIIPVKELTCQTDGGKETIIVKPPTAVLMKILVFPITFSSLKSGASGFKKINKILRGTYGEYS